MPCPLSTACIYQKKSDDILLARGNFRIEKFGLVFGLALLLVPWDISRTFCIISLHLLLKWFTILFAKLQTNFSLFAFLLASLAKLLGFHWLSLLLPREKTLSQILRGDCL